MNKIVNMENDSDAEESENVIHQYEDIYKLEVEDTGEDSNVRCCSVIVPLMILSLTLLMLYWNLYDKNHGKFTIKKKC